MKNDIEPLEPNLWFNLIEKLLDRGSSLESETPSALLRQAMHVAQLAPRPLRDTVRTFTDEEFIERMLDSGAFTAAAMALMPLPMTFMLKQTKTGAYLASVSCSNSECRGKGKARSPEKALLIAWCSFLLELREQALQLTGQSPHISRSVQRQQLTEH